MKDDPNKQGNDGTNDETEETVDWKAKYEEMRAHARDWENKAKANKGAADELEKLKAENLSEQEKAIARAEKAEAELLKANAERAEMYTRIASKTKLPLEVIQTLNGEDEDALVQQANALKKLLPNYPDREDDGGGNSSAKKTNADRFAEAFGL